MSLRQNVTTKFMRLDSLEKAVKKQGWFMEYNTTKRAHADTDEGKVYPVVARNSERHQQAYDIGFVEHDGKYDTEYDSYGGSVEEAFGRKLCGLKTNYQLEEANRVAELYGASVTVEEVEGELEVCLVQ